MLETLFQLIVGHAVADYPLQSEAMARGKNRNRFLSLSDIPPGQKPVSVWWHYMTAHALVHAGAVGIVTGSTVLAVTEFILHWIIDFAKCENWTNPHQDQALHLLCKVVYAAVMCAGGACAHG